MACHVLTLPFLLAALCSCCSGDDGPLVSTPSGDLRGVEIKTTAGVTVNAFLGVPYAEPPIRELRFKRPKPKEAWKGIYDATEQPKPCVQPEFEFKQSFANEIYGDEGRGPKTENCLYLNIWAPKDAKNAPVMIWFHGGGFIVGGTNSLATDGTHLAATEDVIVVSVQFRLGFWGFLYLGTLDAPGNMGLLDQHLAIRWVNKNIKSLGGDPDRVTLFGHSSGAASVVLHTLSSLKRYFQNVILLSPPGLMQFSYKAPELMLNISREITTALGCEGDVEDIMKCVHKIGSQELLEKVHEFGGYAATVDDRFLKKVPDERNVKMRDINVMMGNNENEGFVIATLFRPEFQKTDTKPDLSEEEYKEFLSKALVNQDEDTKAAADKFYKANYKHYLDRLDALWGDLSCTCLINRMALMFSELRTNVYFYRLGHRSSACFYPEWQGVGHGCEVDLIFGTPLGLNPVYSGKDIKASKTIMKYFANFARTGNPNGKGLAEWPLFKSSTKKFMNLEMEPKSDVDLRSYNCRYLERLLAQAAEKPKKRDEL